MRKLLYINNIYRWYSVQSGYFGPEFKTEKEAKDWYNSNYIDSF